MAHFSSPSPPPASNEAARLQARRRRRKNKRGALRLAARFAFPVLVCGATVGAFAGGQALKRLAEPSQPTSITTLAAPLDRTLAQVAEKEGGSNSGGRAKTRSGGETNETASDATLDTVYALVKEHYVDELPSDRVLTGGAVRALLQSLGDPNCQYLEPAQRALLENEAKGVFVGIGAALAVRAQKQNGYTEYKLVVVAPLPGSPAEAAGLKPGDVITHIGGKWVLGYDPFLKASKLAQRLQASGNDANDASVRKTYDAARARLRGGIGLFAAQMALKGEAASLKTANLPGDRLLLTVERRKEKASDLSTLSVSVPLKETRIDAVLGKPLSPGVGYVKISYLGGTVESDLRKTLADVPHNKGLVVDLRNAAGGTVDTAQVVESLIPTLAKETSLSRASVPFGYELQGKAHRTISVSRKVAHNDGNPDTTEQIVVLVNGGTASSAESLAAALQFSRSAALVGSQNTFGDALEQSVYPLPGGAAFTLTTGELLTPRKQHFSERGLTPTVPVVLLPASGGDPVLARAVSLLSHPIASSRGSAVRQAKSSTNGRNK